MITKALDSKMKKQMSLFSLATAAAFHVLLVTSCAAWSPSSSSSFMGERISSLRAVSQTRTVKSYISMRKQKASDKRTSRRQREGRTLQLLETPTITASPMQGNAWKQKVVEEYANPEPITRGRQRSRKRSNLYNMMARYHNSFLSALTLEYKAEVRRN